MITKAFEIRDRGTFIPVIATKMTPTTVPPVSQTIDDWHKSAEAERYLLRRSGYSADWSDYCVIVCRMDASGSLRCASYDPYGWSAGDRTFQISHNYILEHFDELESGAVIDVEFLLGESKEPKRSERLDAMS